MFPSEAPSEANLKTEISIKHLIVVCCHAIYLGSGSSSTSAKPASNESAAFVELPSDNEANWLIEPFQKGETATYISHIKAGVEALAADEHAILVFSGGATKPQLTDKTEGDGYLNVALEQQLFGSKDPALSQRMFVDRFATDSYQNILCSLIQFPLFVQELQGHACSLSTKESPQAIFPNKLIIVSHEFKRARFLDLHAPALQWFGETKFIGINPPFDSVKMAEIEEGDRLRGFGAWKKDIYGVGPALADKRLARGWNEDLFRARVLAKFSDESLRNRIFHFVALRQRYHGQDLSKSYEEKLPWS
ncbi:hypothetical protein LTR84_011355 [Exophiala bonariae]|uniref:DUF218 domain-containing protein n=1 Tax=Exophiala bonariae TaxID=1690606 RepID=A0AAV9MTS0_9EURO|nr:hypothetical protein LTR84_011355 [Exophiala bonariae]